VEASGVARSASEALQHWPTTACDCDPLIFVAHPADAVRWGEKSCGRTDTRAMGEQRLILVVEDDEATRPFLLENLAA
jgi:hypothetical protein